MDPNRMSVDKITNLYGGYFLTPQEHLFLGSSSEEKYMKNPYSPLAVQDGWDSWVVDHIRGKFQVFQSAALLWLNKDGTAVTDSHHVRTLLSQLNSAGDTLFNPISLQPELSLNPKYLEHLMIRK
jgi:hypothetical protein